MVKKGVKIGIVIFLVVIVIAVVTVVLMSLLANNGWTKVENTYSYGFVDRTSIFDTLESAKVACMANSACNAITLSPNALLLPPVELVYKEYRPSALLFVPPVLEYKALLPSALLLLESVLE